MKQTDQAQNLREFVVKLEVRKGEWQANARRTSQQVAAAFAPRQSEFDRRMTEIRAMGGSRKKRLRALLSAVSDVRAVAAPFIPCCKGCSGCCYQLVAISQLEAEHIHDRYGHQMARVIQRASIDAVGTFGRDTPCTFLDADGNCAIYDARPFACRNQVSLDVDSLLCQPENIQLAQQRHPASSGVPMLVGGPLQEAYFELIGSDVVADIRTFFPPRATAQLNENSGE
ncbi:YkgJ family cysteine cluster protein [Burkholderia cenocepacia]|uniref:YkgJ family cysteine cluster protein n=1 Tax=Burkholderia cenocepacia TaxID=95486 RepID=UPI001B972656|nr:YkgJ family cysteine cluster protein [Burkholderia cenocepacia]MBR8426167.1 YkgJ family cysteine cluster protein [Burkholderia cenocepacia]